MIVAITGTGTNIGKTHVACALVTAMRAAGMRAVAWKPVESGVEPGEGDPPSGSDEQRLRDASKVISAPTLRLREPLSPHLAARRQRVAIDGVAIRKTLDQLAIRHEVVVLELAGGLCSPFDDTIDNAEWLVKIPDLRLVLVAPDRLGVLHDVVAAVRAANQVGFADAAIATLALVAPETPDASTSSNAAELRTRRAIRDRPVIELPRASVEDLATHPAIAKLIAELRGR